MATPNGFEFYQDARRDWRWRRWSFGRIIAESGEGYRNRGDCLTAARRSGYTG